MDTADSVIRTPRVYSTPWGVRKIYLSNGCIVTTYPDGTKTQQNPDGSEIRKLKDGTVLQVSVLVLPQYDILMVRCVDLSL